MIRDPKLQTPVAPSILRRSKNQTHRRLQLDQARRMVPHTKDLIRVNDP